MKNRSPHINKTIWFDKIDPSRDKLVIEFWDTNDKTDEDIKIGEASVPLQRFQNNKEEYLTLELSNSSTVFLHVCPFNFNIKQNVRQAFKPANLLDIRKPLVNFLESPLIQLGRKIENNEMNHERIYNDKTFDRPPPSAIIVNNEIPFIRQENIRRDFPQLSQGSFGIVYTGSIPNLKEKVVIKDIKNKDKYSIRDWKKEIDMMCRLRSPYVVDIIGYSSSDTTLTIIMEYFQKGSLYEVLHINNEKLSLLQRMRMAKHCALGLEHLHKLGVIHRDIKSMNILVADDLSCKLTDFGTAKNLKDKECNQINTANSGTPLWMAPEVKHGTLYDFSADIYSLGLVLYELFENELPGYNKITQMVELPQSFKSSTIVLSCINKDPKMRPTASMVVERLNKMIRNVLNKVRACLPKEDETILKIKSMKIKGKSNDNESELLLLYNYLLKKDPSEVDALIDKAFKSNNVHNRYVDDKSNNEMISPKKIYQPKHLRIERQEWRQIRYSP